MLQRPDKPFLTRESPSAITIAGVQEFYDYWKACGEKGNLPGWRDIDLMSIYHLSPWVVVKDVVDGGRDFRNRFWGTEIALAHDFDATGLCYEDYLQLESAQEELDLYRSIMETRKPVKISGTMEMWRKKDHIWFEGVICPLVDENDQVSMLIACYYFDLTDA